MKRIYYLAVLLLGLAATACSKSEDQPSAAPELAKLSIKFVYNYNLLWANAIDSQNLSANVWAFTQNGELAWSGATSAADLEKDSFCIIADLPAGKYDLIAWCGLQENDAFELASYKPKSKEELTVKIKTIDSNGLQISEKNLHGLYYGYVKEVNVNSGDAANNTVTMSLIKDTNDIDVQLRYLSSTQIDVADFYVSITDDNGTYAWDNSVVPSKTITYVPWKAVSNTFSLSVGRFILNSNPRLSVTSKIDNKVIAQIPLLNYLLLAKSNLASSSLLSNLEFLDREDSYSLFFVLNEENNSLVQSGINVNGLQVVVKPDQEL